MALVKTKQKIKSLIDDVENPRVLREIRRLLELEASENSLTEKQKRELDELKKADDAGKVKRHSWDVVRKGLLKKLKE